jgi:hypothetical protein
VMLTGLSLDLIFLKVGLLYSSEARLNLSSTLLDFQVHAGIVSRFLLASVC